MLKYDQFVFESMSNKTFGEMQDMFLKPYKDEVKKMIISSLKRIVGNFTIKKENEELCILIVKTDDNFEISIMSNSSYRKIMYSINDLSLEYTLFHDSGQFAKIETFEKDLKNKIDYVRSNLYRSKKGIEKFNL